jgi:F0F1-type ATP synthase assembly protein I
MTVPLIVETDLKEILIKIDQKLDKLDERIGRLEVGQAEMRTDLNTLKEDSKDLKIAQRAQIWTLIGILGTAVIGTVIRYLLTSFPQS